MRLKGLVGSGSSWSRQLQLGKERVKDASRKGWLEIQVCPERQRRGWHKRNWLEFLARAVHLRVVLRAVF